MPRVVPGVRFGTMFSLRRECILSGYQMCLSSIMHDTIHMNYLPSSTPRWNSQTILQHLASFENQLNSTTLKSWQQTSEIERIVRVRIKSHIKSLTLLHFRIALCINVPRHRETWCGVLFALWIIAVRN